MVTFYREHLVKESKKTWLRHFRASGKVEHADGHPLSAGDLVRDEDPGNAMVVSFHLQCQWLL